MPGYRLRVDTPQHPVPDVVEVAVSSPEEPATEGSAPDHSRSGEDIAEAIEVAERGSSVEEVHDRGPEDTKSGEAPVEQAAGDPEMTEGQVVLGEGEPGGHRSVGLDPEAGRLRVPRSRSPGARVSDRVAAGEEQPAGPLGRLVLFSSTARRAPSAARGPAAPAGTAGRSSRPAW